jgi:hypothetical protein
MIMKALQMEIRDADAALRVVGTQTEQQRKISLHARIDTIKDADGV